MVGGNGKSATVHRVNARGIGGQGASTSLRTYVPMVC